MFTISFYTTSAVAKQLAKRTSNDVTLFFIVIKLHLCWFFANLANFHFLHTRLASTNMLDDRIYCVAVFRAALDEVF